MILPDINLLVHAHNLDSPKHRAAAKWWDSQLAGTTGVALAWVVILGFVRITTNRAVLQNPWAPEEALQRVEEWLTLSHVFIPLPSDRHFSLLKSLLLQTGAAGNLTTDAHLAALAIERGLVLHSTDTDFGRFPGLKWINPLLK
jgi:toxin-antitoxin system PIN domain toxin